MDENTSNPEQKKGRLQNPVWLILSIIATVFAVTVFLYSLYRGILSLPIAGFFLFIFLWFFPISWAKIEEVFGKRPRTLWGRISLNLAIAVLLSVTFEDVFELTVKGIKLIIYLFGK